MKTHLAVAAVSLMLGGYAAAAETPMPDAAAPRDAASMQADAMKLCDRLAGTEREICVKQAAEHQRMAEPPALGATPGMPGGGTVRPPLPETAKPAR